MRVVLPGEVACLARAPAGEADRRRTIQLEEGRADAGDSEREQQRHDPGSCWPSAHAQEHRAGERDEAESPDDDARLHNPRMAGGMAGELADVLRVERVAGLNEPTYHP